MQHLVFIAGRTGSFYFPIKAQVCCSYTFVLLSTSPANDVFVRLSELYCDHEETGRPPVLHWKTLRLFVWSLSHLFGTLSCLVTFHLCGYFLVIHPWAGLSAPTGSFKIFSLISSIMSWNICSDVRFVGTIFSSRWIHLQWVSTQYDKICWWYNFLFCHQTVKKLTWAVPGF